MSSEFEEQVQSFCETQRTVIMNRAPEDIKNRLDVLRNVLKNNPMPSSDFPHLWVKQKEESYWFVLKATITIGANAKNDLQLTDEYISEQHCEMKTKDQNWHILDSKSTNGVFVNGKRIARQKLKDGDIIQLGDTSLIFFSASEGD